MPEHRQKTAETVKYTQIHCNRKELSAVTLRMQIAVVLAVVLVTTCHADHLDSHSRGPTTVTALNRTAGARETLSAPSGEGDMQNVGTGVSFMRDQ